MKKTLILTNILTVLLSFPLTLPVRAEDSLQTQIDAIKAQHEFTDQDFSYIYYNTVTGEYIADNPDTFLFAASLYKLPLNLYYYTNENNGLISPDTYVNGYVLSNAQELSIRYSDNAASEAMIYGIGTFEAYRETMFETFDQDHLDALHNLDYDMYMSNYYPSKIFFNALKYLYDNQQSFTTILEYMSAADQNNDVALTLPDQVTVYQKQGWYENGTNNVAEIVESQEPYILVIMINNAYGYSQDVLQEIHSLVYTYNITHIHPESTPAPTPAADESAAIVQSKEHSAFTKYVFIGGVCSVAVMLLCLLRMLRRH